MYIWFSISYVCIQNRKGVVGTAVYNYDEREDRMIHIELAGASILRAELTAISKTLQDDYASHPTTLHIFTRDSLYPSFRLLRRWVWTDQVP